MGNKKIAACLCMAFLLVTTGCGNSDTDADASTVDTINFWDVADTGAEENNNNPQSNHRSDEENVDNQQDSDIKGNSPSGSGEGTDNQSDNAQLQPDSGQSQADNAQLQPDSSQSQADNAQLQPDVELDGSIESIGDNSVVINQTFHPSANTAVSYQDSEKVLVTVYFSGETEFEVWTVKNGGVNGDADTEKRQGVFSDLMQGANINMTGNYDGNDFYAKHVIIYHFV